MFDFFEKIKGFFGGGTSHEEATREEIAALVRAVAHGLVVQEILFRPENEKCLYAFVEYGHTLKPAYLGKFFAEAPAELVKIYLERGEEISDENKMVIISRKDSSLVEAMMDSGSWRPFPYGVSSTHPTEFHHEHLDALDAGEYSMA